MTEAILETERLSLHLISVDDLITLFEEPTNMSIYEGKPFTNPHRVLMDDSGPLPWRVPQMKVDPSLNIWFVRWVVVKESQEIIGSISFHGAPDSTGMVEIGLGIEKSFRNQGFGFEALMAMWRWAIEKPRVETLRYTVSATNFASVRLVEKFGFVHVGQQLDEFDGPEEMYEMSATDFRTRYLSF